MGKKLTTVQYRKRTALIKRLSLLSILVFIVFACYLYYKYKPFTKKHTSKTVAKIASNQSVNVETINPEMYDSSTSEYSDSNIIDNLPHITYNEDTINPGTSFNSINSSNSTNYNNSFSSSSSSSNTDTNPGSKAVITNLDEADSHFNFYKNNSQDEIDYNNAQIAEYTARQEELNKIKETYEEKNQAVEAWYQNEYNTTYDLMIEAQRNMKDAGGRASKDDVANKYKEKASIPREMLNSGMSNSGYSQSRLEQWEKEYNAICKRYSYTKQYDEYYYYLYTTLPASKNQKLLEIVGWYKQELQNYENKYNY